MAAIHALLGYALLVGLGVTAPGPAVESRTRLIVIEQRPPPPPREPPPPKQAASRGGAPAAPQKAPPLPTKAEIPIPALPAPTPIILAAPPSPAGGGPAANGTGGSGAGSGSGGIGTGSGDGIGNGAVAINAEQIRGRIRDSDFPRAVRSVAVIALAVRYAVLPSGQPDQCEVTRSSGYPEVDAMTCRVIVERYRFRPARNAAGAPVTEVIEEDYEWVD